jgi:hypothetical protein
MSLLTGKQPVLGAATEMSLLTRGPDSTGGSQSALVDKLEVSPISSSMVYIAKSTGDEQKAHTGISSEMSVLPHHSKSTDLPISAGIAGVTLQF